MDNIALDHLRPERMPEEILPVHDVRPRRRAHQPPPLPTTLPDDPRVRSLRVTPHALAPYDNLVMTEPENPNDDTR